MKRLAIVGGGDHSLQIAHVARMTKQYNPMFVFDDFQEPGTPVGNMKVLGPISSIEKFFEEGTFDEVILGIGYNHLEFRKKVYEDLVSQSIKLATLIHPTANFDDSCTIHPGAVLYPGCILDMNVTIGPNSIIHCGCVIAHDSKVEGHSFLSPSVNIAGYTTIGSLVHVGIGVTIIDRLNICSNVRIGAGSLIIRNITEEGLYFGRPVKKMK